MRKILSFVGRLSVGLLKLFLGVLFCQNLLPSILVVGWTYRLVRRSVYKRWILASTVMRTDPWFRGGAMPASGWPNWLLQENVGIAWMESRRRGLRLRKRLGLLLKIPLHSLWLNFKVGFQGIFNTWVVTMPPCILWLFAWYDGWNNSFTKGYEQAAVGPLTGLLGVGLFIAVMLYVPMAQTRQAATGRFASFYQFKLIWALVRRKWIACLCLAGVYAIVAMPINIIKIIPGFFPHISSELVEKSPAEMLTVLKSYFLWTTLICFPAYVLVRLIAARIYAAGFVALAEEGTLRLHDLGKEEKHDLEILRLLRPQPRPRRRRLARALGWAATRTGRILSTTAAILLWFVFVAQIFIAEFFVYHQARGWLNQPLVQLPYFSYVPSALREEAKEQRR